MPESFQPDLLRPLLRPLAMGGDELPQAAAYRRFYGLGPVRSRAPVQSRLGCFEVAGYRIVAQVWWPPRPRATLLLLHGYFDHMGLYRHVLDWALEMGFAVLACDLPGHGLSSGVPASIGDFAEYQAVFQGLLGEARALDLPKPWHLFGQSTGGAILLDHLLTGTPCPEQGETILFAPLVRPRRWSLSKTSYRLLRPFVGAIPRRFTANCTDAEFLDFIQHRDPLQPRLLPTAWVGALARWIPRIESAPRSRHSPLIVQGGADLTVDWRHNLAVLRAKFRDPSLLLLPEARHHLANEPAAQRQRYFDFLRERLG